MVPCLNFSSDSLIQSTNFQSMPYSTTQGTRDTKVAKMWKSYHTLVLFPVGGK